MVDAVTGEEGPLERLRGLKVLAFAGIGTPEAFFRELGDLGAKVLQCVPFPDHHRYIPADLEQVVNWARLMNAQALITTEQDGVLSLAHLPLPLPALVLRIQMAVLDRPEEFRARILAAAVRKPRR